jgi:hypothetical protein
MICLIFRSSVRPCQLVVAVQYISSAFRDDPERCAVFNVKLMVKRGITNGPFTKLDVLVASAFAMHTFQIVAKLKVFTAPTELRHHMFA